MVFAILTIAPFILNSLLQPLSLYFKTFDVLTNSPLTTSETMLRDY